MTYISLFLSDLFISNILSSNCALVFRLGQNLSYIPRSILSKQKFHLSYLSQSTNIQYLTSFLQIRILFSAQIFVSQCCALSNRYTHRSFFSSVSINHRFRSRQRNHLLAQGQTRVSILQQCTKKTLTTGPSNNTCETNEVSPEVEAGVVAGLKCLQPRWDTDM
jgi:hypothetical protein